MRAMQREGLNDALSIEDGREALERQVRLMFCGSHVYKPSMTIAEVARHYTVTDPEIWARNVAAHLGVTVETRLDQIELCLHQRAD